MSKPRNGLMIADGQGNGPCVLLAFRKVMQATIWVAAYFAGPATAWAGSDEPGLNTTDVMRSVAFWSAAVAIMVLVVVELILQRRIGRAALHWLLLMGLLVLPMLSLTATTTVILEETKTVNSCASCHSMDPFVNDMRNPASTTLAARHFINKWIPENQCYECHTTYGAHGTFKAKLVGLRHWWKYTTDDWERPITYVGKYPDANCLKCHEGTPGYLKAPPHQAAFKALETGEVDCLFCHGPPHPTAEQRKDVPKYPSAEPPKVEPNGSPPVGPPEVTNKAELTTDKLPVQTKLPS